MPRGQRGSCEVEGRDGGGECWKLNVRFFRVLYKVAVLLLKVTLKPGKFLSFYFLSPYLLFYKVEFSGV